MGQCEAISNPNTVWPQMCPSLPAAYLYAVFFGASTIAHLAQMIMHRKWYSLVIVASGALQTAAYVFRVLSIHDVTNVGYYSDWFIIMMIAPVWTNAYAYMVMGRMVYNFTPSASVFKVKAWRFGLIFVLLDVFAFLVQAAGAVIASGDNKSTSTIMTGLHVYMGGVGFQQLCIFFFMALAVRFHLKLRLQQHSPERSRALTLLYIEYAVLLLITVRIIFRLIEYSNGLKSSIPKHEVYQYIFDSTVMFIALVLYNVFHPGRLMPGKESDLPSRKVRKAWKREGVQPHGRVGGDYLLPKYESEGMSGSDAALGQYARVQSPLPSRDNSPGR